MRAAGATTLRRGQSAVLVDGDQVTSGGGFGSKLVISPRELRTG